MIPSVSGKDALPELSNFYCHPGRAGGSPDGLALIGQIRSAAVPSSRTLSGISQFAAGVLQSLIQEARVLSCRPADLSRPGHMFPLRRAGRDLEQGAAVVHVGMRRALRITPMNLNSAVAAPSPPFAANRFQAAQITFA